MLAYVRYSDGEYGVMPCSLIKNFAPANVRDFKKGEARKAFWFRKRDKEMQGFYDAEVKVLAETMGSLLQQLEEQRLPVPCEDYIFEEGDFCNGLAVTATEKNKAWGKKEAQKNSRTAKNMQLKSILGKRKDTSDATTAAVEERIRYLEAQNEKLKEELEVCQQRLHEEGNEKKKFMDMSHRLTESLMEKIDVIASHVSTNQSASGASATRLVPTISPDTVPVPVAVASACNLSSQFFLELPGDHAHSQDHEDNDSIPLYGTIDNEIHFGNNIFMSCEKFSWILRSKSDAIFCKDMARSLWDVSDLRNRSVTGTLCPRFSKTGATAREPLTPEKVQAISNAFIKYAESKPSTEAPVEKRVKRINKHLAGFLRDLRR